MITNNKKTTEENLQSECKVHQFKSAGISPIPHDYSQGQLVLFCTQCGKTISKEVKYYPKNCQK